MQESIKPPNQMNLMNLVAGLAFACFATGTYAQGCGSHASAAKGNPSDMATVAKELKLTAEQQEAFTTALAACEKDCAAMASKGGDAAAITTAKEDRFKSAVASMKGTLSEEQYKQLEAMHASGKLAGLCGDSKGCGKGSGKAGCCSSKAGAQHTEKRAETGSTPSIQ